MINNEEDQPESDGFALVFPFIVCQSQGGIVDNSAAPVEREPNELVVPARPASFCSRDGLTAETANFGLPDGSYHLVMDQLDGRAVAYLFESTTRQEIARVELPTLSATPHDMASAGSTRQALRAEARRRGVPEDEIARAYP